MSTERRWQGPPAARRRAEWSSLPLWSAAILFIAAHVPLAILMRYVSLVTSVHAILTVVVGVRWAFSPLRRLDEVALVAAYITGSETLWRMTNDVLFWELAKYSVTAIFVVALLRVHGLKTLVVPAACFALLVPSAFRTLSLHPWAAARNDLSFNLSGPLALVICSAFFAKTRLSSGQLQRFLVSWIAPTVGVAGYVTYDIVTNPNIQFMNTSNKYLSGGFGPNQVSAALGLGALLALLFLIDRQVAWKLRVVMFGLMVWLTFQSALTFSRGGLFCAAGSALAVLFCVVRDPRALMKVTFATTLLVLLGYYVVWPRLDAFTEGGLSQRFQDTRTTGRNDLSQEDLHLFEEHPILGVGPGRAALEHHLGLAAHTEFTRLLAEHGLFGCVAILALATAAYGNFRKAKSPREQGVAAAMTAWSVLFMLNSAMRLVAPCLAFGCAFATVEPEEDARAVIKLECSRRTGRTRRAFALAR